MNKSQKIQAEAARIVREYENAASAKSWRGEEKPNPVKFVLGDLVPNLFKPNGKINIIWAIINIGKLIARIKALWMIAKTETK